MKRFNPERIIAALLAGLLFTQAGVSSADDDPQSLFNQIKRAVANALEDLPVDSSSVNWHATLEAAVTEARDSGKPILAIVGAPWCSFCEKLEAELKGNLEEEIAKQWVLAKINADDEVNDARELHANGLPAIRLLSSDGIVTASRDGYAPASQLARWLEDNYETTKAQMPSLLTKDIEELDSSEIETLVNLMAIRDVTARRVVLNRLSEMPQHAAGPTIQLLQSDRLAYQLSALQLLRVWEAPIDGLDPWEPGSIDDAAIETLNAWGKANYPPAPPAAEQPETTTSEQPESPESERPQSAAPEPFKSPASEPPKTPEPELPDALNSKQSGPTTSE